MEQYLKDDYRMEDLTTSYTKYGDGLSYEQFLKEYYSDECYDYFDCGQGYYQDKISTYACIDDRFFKTVLIAEIDSSKQDHGDRLYWVDGLDKVTVTEIEKPLAKERKIFTVIFNPIADSETSINQFKNKIKEMGGVIVECGVGENV